MKEDTKIVVVGRDPERNHGIVNPPVYHASTILSSSIAEMEAKQAARHRGERGVYYGRFGTPTTFSLEDLVAEIEGGHACMLYSSGLGAIAAALLAFLKAGDHLLMVDSVYGPSRVFCDTVLVRFGIETTYYDPLVGAGIADLMRPTTAVVFVESPGSQTFEVQDVPAIAEAAHRAGATLIMDNTWASPLYFKPFAHGVDVSIQAATKYIVGHSDALLGTATATEAAWPRLRETGLALGQCAGPDDVYLSQRGMRTLAARLERHQESGLAVAEWLAGRPEVARILHPALPGCPGHETWKRDFLGASGLFSFILKPCSKEALAAFVDGLELFGLGASWGGYESLILPQRPQRTAVPWRAEGPLVRLHIGLEDVDDLKADLAAGLDRLRAST